MKSFETSKVSIFLFLTYMILPRSMVILCCIIATFEHHEMTADCLEPDFRLQRHDEDV